jgi:hypothetical protein
LKTSANYQSRGSITARALEIDRSVGKQIISQTALRALVQSGGSHIHGYFIKQRHLIASVTQKPKSASQASAQAQFKQPIGHRPIIYKPSITINQ